MGKNNWLTPALCLVAFFLASGFTVPKPGEVRKEIRQRLEKIQEMTPGARERARWLQSRAIAYRALEKAGRQSASRFAAGKWQEALSLFALAEEYAGKKSFRKADYLARKVSETASGAVEEAVQARKSARSGALGKIRRIEGMLSKLESRCAADNSTAAILLNMKLDVSNLKNLVRIDNYTEFDREAGKLEKRLASMECGRGN